MQELRQRSYHALDATPLVLEFVTPITTVLGSGPPSSAETDVAAMLDTVQKEAVFYREQARLIVWNLLHHLPTGLTDALLIELSGAKSMRARRVPMHYTQEDSRNG